MLFGRTSKIFLPSLSFWAESLILAQISVMDYKSAPKMMSCREKPEFIGQSAAFLWLVLV